MGRSLVIVAVVVVVEIVVVVEAVVVVGVLETDVRGRQTRHGNF